MKALLARLMLPAAMATIVAYGSSPQAFQPEDDQRYRLVKLDSLDGPDSRGHSINNLGWVSGYADAPGSTHREAILWLWGFRIPLGTLGGPNSAIVWPVKNNTGLLVGIAQTRADDPEDEEWSCASFFVGTERFGPVCRGFAWEFGFKRALPTLGGTHSYAAGANNHRQIVGWAENDVRDDECVKTQKFQFHAVIWGPGRNQIQKLPPLAPHKSGAATAINDLGQVVGISGRCDQAVGRFTALSAVLWENGVPTDIGNLGGDTWNTPSAINERGEVVGFASSPGDDPDRPRLKAFYWNKNQGIQEIKPLDGHATSRAWGINGMGQVVGTSCPATGPCHAYLWQDGKLTNLNDATDKASDDHLDSAQDINDFGQITGRVTNLTTGARNAYVLVPKPR
jgi:probable HAF family extracellular repeat protein